MSQGNHVLQSAIAAVVGPRMRILRVARGMSQAAVGLACDVTRAQIANCEGGLMVLSVGRIYAFCALMGIEIADLFPTVNEAFEEATRPDAYSPDPVAFAHIRAEPTKRRGRQTVRG